MTMKREKLPFSIIAQSREYVRPEWTLLDRLVFGILIVGTPTMFFTGLALKYGLIASTTALFSAFH